MMNEYTFYSFLRTFNSFMLYMHNLSVTGDMYNFK